MLVGPDGRPVGPRPSLYPRPAPLNIPKPISHTELASPNPQSNDPRSTGSGHAPPRPGFNTRGPPLKVGSMMSASDIRFVVGKVLQPVETVDPFSDDYYFLQHALKKHHVEQLRAAQNPESPFVPPLVVPLPAWKV